MPFPLIPTALAVCFLLMWALIAGMIFRDGQLAVRRDRDWDDGLVTVPRRHRPPVPKFLSARKRGRRLERPVRAAS
jgi:hypothetical protein